MKVGVIGAGAISDIYLQNMIGKFDNLEVLSIAATHLDHAQHKGDMYGLRACTVDEMLADPEIELVVNLTPAAVHYELNKKALLAGKHVYTEKVMTDNPETAEELVRLADEKGLYLGAAPDTFLGSSWQTAKKAIEDGLIGEVTSFSATANRCNDVLLSLFSFLRMPGGGIVMDFGVYYLTVLVNLLGPVEETAAYVRAPFPQHTNIIPSHPLYGQVMDTPNESEVSAILKMKSGVCGTFHLNADSILQEKPKFLIYGTKGILELGDPNKFGDPVRLIRGLDLAGAVDARKTGKFPEPEVLTPVNEFSGNERGLGVSEMVSAIAAGRPNAAGKEQALHVLKVLEAMLQSGKTGTFRKIED